MPMPEALDDARLREADLRHCLHPWTDFPEWKQTGSTIIARAEGANVWDAAGRRYIDAMGGLWFANVGYGRKELVDTAARQLSLLPQYSYFTDFGNPPATELAAVIAKLTPGDLDHVFYSSSGSTANDTAIRIAHYYFDTIGKPSKRYVISRKNAYHGSTYLTAALSGKEGDRSGFKFPPGLVHHVSDANCYRMPDGIRDEGEYCDYLVDEFETKVRSLGAGNIACFIAEPVMGAGGVLVAPEGYHRLMKNVCSENDILYISDEVVTGFGRLGHFFASHDRFDIVPDMIVVAKGITSGYIPLAATIVSEKVYEGLSQPRKDGGIFSHGFTYSGHAAACAVALENINIIKREAICEKVRKTGPYLIEKLQQLRRHEFVGDVRGSHFMACVELVADRERKTPFPMHAPIRGEVEHETQARGLIVRMIGDLCVLSPALTLDHDQIDEIVGILDASLDAVCRRAGGSAQD